MGMLFTAQKSKDGLQSQLETPHAQTQAHAYEHASLLLPAPMTENPACQECDIL
jgi:hypothetical protein